MPTQQNGQKHASNSFGCVWPFCGDGASSVKIRVSIAKTLCKIDLKNKYRVADNYN